MELRGKTVLILGGSGLVGRAVARRLLERRPKKIVLVGLFEHELRRELEVLKPFAGDTSMEIAWGNVFAPASLAKMGRAEMLASAEHRRAVVDDLLGELTPAVLERSSLYQLFMEHRPHAVVDSINTATAFAYQDVFTSAQRLVEAARQGQTTPEMVEEHVLSIPMPQLIRHIQIVLEAVKAAGTEAYVKVGTSGTGGMGLNIPYTHSEERPSRILMTKSAIAGGHTLMLFLIARTPGAPATAEIKPTAAIAWREIAFGPIRRWGRNITRYDCPEPLTAAEAFGNGCAGWNDTGTVLESVYADVGENGYFARDEFETVTALQQMEFITPEEVADYVVMELEGRASGRDVVAALDSATAGPTYRAGVLRAAAIERLAELEEKHGVRAVAFEMLGPPRLSKLLYEGFVLSRLRESVQALADSDPTSLAGEAQLFVMDDVDLRQTIISVGLPILVDGDRIYRGGEVIVPPTNDDMTRAAHAGWVDLRESNCATWIARAREVVAQGEGRPSGSGSGDEWGAMEPSSPIRPPAFATWVFRNEDDGERIKR